MTQPIDDTHAPYDLPLPRVTDVSRPFWDAAKAHRLVLQRSRRTGKFVFYPRIVSPFAAADDLEWTEVSGRGTVVGRTVVRQTPDHALARRVPYAIAVVELEEGARMTTNVVGCGAEDVTVGMAVVVHFDDVTPERTLIKFRPA